MKTSLARCLASPVNTPLVFVVRVLLLPFYLAYLLVVSARNALYDSGLLAPVHVGVPVVSVGNLTVGGTGKTPLVIALAQQALGQGRKVAIVARAYGAVADAEGRTDEVALMAQRVPGAQVVMAPDKLMGARRAAASGADLILVDDGFQHRRLHRDLDIVVVNARAPMSNGYVLPLGGLREPPSGLGRADAVVLTHFDGLDDSALETVRSGLLAWKRELPIAWGRHVPLGVRPVAGGALAPLDSLRGQEVYLFCGLAEPEGFRRTVEALGAHVQGLCAFPDHHAFDAASLAEVRSLARTARLLCTEKDAAKVAAIPGSGDILCLVIELVIEGSLPALPVVAASSSAR